MEEPEAPAPGRSAPSRRRFLLGSGAAVVAAGGGGALAALVRHRPAPPAPVAAARPTVLIAALAAEQRLIAAIDAANDAKDLAHLRADHVEHMTALLGAIRVAQHGKEPIVVPVTRPAGMTLDRLHSAESAAASAAARAAASLTGADAALLASISACEASHAELLR